MRDLVFVGPDLEAALAAASRDLDLPADKLRYVVLDRGTPERLGVKGQPARIAVLLDAPGPAVAAAEPPRATGAPPRPAELIAAFARASGLELEAQEDAAGGERVLRLRGPGLATLLEQGDDLLPALEHLLQRAAHGAQEGSRLRLECEGYREWREERLRARARRLAEAVLADGQPRRTEPLNSYERRLVHMAVSEMPALSSRSEGEEPARHVVIAPAPIRSEGDPD
jgi:spoIIIJ-associated protein